MRGMERDGFGLGVVALEVDEAAVEENLSFSWFICFMPIS